MSRQQPAEAPGERSPAAGGCVLLVLAAIAFAAVFAASTAAGILTVWTAGGAAVWWSARRPNGTDLALPSPTESPSRGDVYAVETGRAASVEKGPGGITIIRPEIEHVVDE